MRRMFPALAAAAALGACTPMQWVKVDAGPAQLERDLAECRQQAWRESRLRAWNWHYPPFGPTAFRDATGRLHYVWPYAPFADPWGDPFFEESRLTQFCMRAKGYELRAIEQARTP